MVFVTINLLIVYSKIASPLFVRFMRFAKMMHERQNIPRIYLSLKVETVQKEGHLSHIP
jgi:hypothetical protein